MGSFRILLFLGWLAVTTPALSLADDNGIQGYGPVAGLSLGPDQLLLGGFVDFGAVASPIRVIGFADIGFGDDRTTVGAGPSFVAMIPVEGLGRFYGGVFLGLNYIRLSDLGLANVSVSNTELAVAADFGLIYPLDSNSLLIDLKVDLANHSDVKLLVGYQIGLD